MALSDITTSGFAFTEFSHDLVRIDSPLTWWGIDANSNGLYDTLAVRVPVRSEVAGNNLATTAVLVDTLGNALACLGVPTNLAEGDTAISLYWPGVAIGGAASVGPLAVRSFGIRVITSTENFTVQRGDLGSIGEIDPSGFEGFVPDSVRAVAVQGVVALCPIGDADSLQLRLKMPVPFGGSPLILDHEIYAVRTGTAGGPVTLWQTDGSGTTGGDTLWVTSHNDADTTAVLGWARGSGCGTTSWLCYVDDQPVGVAVPVDVRSFDGTPYAIGAVDRFDSLLIAAALFTQESCADYTGDSYVGAADWAVFQDHLPVDGHHIPRHLTAPDSGQRYAPQESFYTTWEQGLGDSARVTIRLIRDSEPSWEYVFVRDFRDTTNGFYSGSMPVEALLENGTDYRIQVIHTAGYWLAGTSDVGRATSDPIEIYAVGCPFVQTWTSNGWTLDNTILARSTERALAEDAYLIKSEPDRTGGRLKFRILENADEFTTLDRVSVAALDAPEDEKVLRIGNRYVAGTWEPATTVVKASGEDITHLVDASREEYYIGSPGDTLLVDLPARRALIGIEDGGTFSTTQGGGGSGGSGGGKPIDPAPEGPPDLTTAGAEIDEHYLTETGILVQFRNGNGDWETARHWYPRERFDDFVVDGFVEGQMRLIFLGRHKLRYLGRFNYLQDGVTPKSARLLSAAHSRLGNQLSEVQIADENSTVIAPGDTVTFEFETVAPEAGKARHWFLVTNGVYSSVAPQGYDAGPTAPEAPTYAFALGAAWPNPTSGNVQIDYSLARESSVSLRIYTVAGRLVRDLVGERQKAGPYSLAWNLRDDGGARVPSGVYFYRLVADEWASQKKVVFIDR